jgi:hypothetical protein
MKTRAQLWAAWLQRRASFCSGTAAFRLIETMFKMPITIKIPCDLILQPMDKLLSYSFTDSNANVDVAARQYTWYNKGFLLY